MRLLAVSAGTIRWARHVTAGSIDVAVTMASLAVLLALVQPAALLASPAAKQQHDVLMIAIDDMRNEQGCYGCEYMKTPAMDALAAKSMVMERMYTGIALCSPSRTTLLTSRRPDTSRVWLISGTEYWRVSGGNFTTLPQYFKGAGYLSLGTGKIFHPGAPSGGDDAKYSWSQECLPYKDQFGNPHQTAGAGGHGYSGPAMQKFVNVTDDEMGEGLLATNGVRLLNLVKERRASGDATPFFVAVGFVSARCIISSSFSVSFLH